MFKSGDYTTKFPYRGHVDINPSSESGILVKNMDNTLFLICTAVILCCTICCTKALEKAI